MYKSCVKYQRVTVHVGPSPGCLAVYEQVLQKYLKHFWAHTLQMREMACNWTSNSPQDC